MQFRDNDFSKWFTCHLQTCSAASKQLAQYNLDIKKNDREKRKLLIQIDDAKNTAFSSSETYISHKNNCVVKQDKINILTSTKLDKAFTLDDDKISRETARRRWDKSSQDDDESSPKQRWRQACSKIIASNARVLQLTNEIAVESALLSKMIVIKNERLEICNEDAAQVKLLQKAYGQKDDLICEIQCKIQNQDECHIKECAEWGKDLDIRRKRWVDRIHDDLIDSDLERLRTHQNL